jgi:HK97 family phage prohead protease
MKQTRFIPIGVCGLKVREAGEGEQSRTIEGTPIVFGVRSVNLTPWSETRAVYEVLEKGCITPELLKRSDVILNLNHNSNVTNVLGRFRNTEKDTLQLTLNEDNMECRCDMPHTNNANDTLELMRRGDITGMSFAFSDDYQDSENGVSYERTDEKTEDGKEVWLRHVKRITGLYDVSIVTHPAYEQTSVGTREASDEIEKAIDEQLKREVGHQETDDEREAREAKEREDRELEEQAEKARVMQMHRLRSQRRHIIENVINKL